MAGRLGTQADILMTESVLSNILETIDSMLIESPSAGIYLSGKNLEDGNGSYYRIDRISDEDVIGLSVGSSEGGLEPTDTDLALFKRSVGKGILMKVDVYAHQFSMYRIDDEIADATVLFVE